MTACVVVTIAGHPILGLVAGTLAGAAAGFCTGLLQTKLKIEPILSGILTMTGLYTVNYAILGGQSNRYLQYEAKNSLGVTVNKPADTVYKIFPPFSISDRISFFNHNLKGTALPPTWREPSLPKLRNKAYKTSKLIYLVTGEIRKRGAAVCLLRLFPVVIRIVNFPVLNQIDIIPIALISLLIGLYPYRIH